MDKEDGGSGDEDSSRGPNSNGGGPKVPKLKIVLSGAGGAGKNSVLPYKQAYTGDKH